MLDEESDLTLIDVQEFLNVRSSLVREDYFARNKNVQESINADLSLPEPAFRKLQNMCNPSQLNQSELQDEIKSPEDLDIDDLSVLGYITSVCTHSSKKNQSLDLKFVKTMAKLNELVPGDDNERITTPDVVINAQISHPLSNKMRKIGWSEEFCVLGQNYLSDLKDKISCFRSEVRIGEFSHNPDALKSATAMKEIIRSGYFLIEDTFYNDMREGNADCSTQVIEWAHQKQIAEFTSKSMEDTKFSQLRIRLGVPYLYTHLGNCEHVLVFSGIKLVNPSSDCYVKSKYPIVRDKTRGRFTFCWMCNKLYAKWIVCNSEYAVDDPTFMCERCLRNTHYRGDEIPTVTSIDSTSTASVAPESISEHAPDHTGGVPAFTVTNTSCADNIPVEFRQPNADSTVVDSALLASNPAFKKLFDFKAYHFSQL